MDQIFPYQILFFVTSFRDEDDWDNADKHPKLYS